MRKSDEEIDEELIEEKRERFIRENKNNNQTFSLPDGRKIALSQFAIQPEDLVGGLN